jgi:hypothetical protein
LRFCYCAPIYASTRSNPLQSAQIFPRCFKLEVIYHLHPPNC